MRGPCGLRRVGPRRNHPDLRRWLDMALNRRAQALAQFGEDRAASHVEALGWRVLERNWRCRSGEIDMVAYEPEADTVVFVEVKCRSGYAFGHPLEAITEAKAVRLYGLAVEWLRAHDVHAADVRVDAIGIVARDGQSVELTHVRGIGEP